MKENDDTDSNTQRLVKEIDEYIDNLSELKD